MGTYKSSDYTGELIIYRTGGFGQVGSNDRPNPAQVDGYDNALGCMWIKWQPSFIHPSLDIIWKLCAGPVRLTGRQNLKRDD